MKGVLVSMFYPYLTNHMKLIVTLSHQESRHDLTLCKTHQTSLSDEQRGILNYGILDKQCDANILSTSLVPNSWLLDYCTLYTGWPIKNGTAYFPQYVDAISV